MSVIIDPLDDRKALVDGELATKGTIQFGPVGMTPAELARQPKYDTYVLPITFSKGTDQ